MICRCLSPRALNGSARLRAAAPWRELHEREVSAISGWFESTVINKVCVLNHLVSPGLGELPRLHRCCLKHCFLKFDRAVVQNFVNQKAAPHFSCHKYGHQSYTEPLLLDKTSLVAVISTLRLLVCFPTGWWNHWGPKGQWPRCQWNHRTTRCIHTQSNLRNRTLIEA